MWTSNGAVVVTAAWWLHEPEPAGVSAQWYTPVVVIDLQFSSA
jgi:hypothetical protein